MKALFIHDSYYSPHQDAVYVHGAFPYKLWAERFLPHFKNLTIIGREKNFQANLNLPSSHGDRVDFLLLPNINTPLSRINASAVKRRIKAAVADADAVIIRGPAELGMIAAHAAHRAGKPVAVEMSGCAFDHTWHHGSLLGKAYAPLKYLRARNMLRRADFVMYVTRDFLQKRYPSNGQKSNASNVEISEISPQILQERLSRIESNSGKTIFGLIGNYGNDLKGLRTLFEAFFKVKSALPPFELRILGQGDAKRWEGAIKRAGLEEYVFFSNLLPPEKVFEWLDEIDVYLQPSLHEGLPRALIEALSRGLPALASDAGGIPELLWPENIHRKGDATTLARHLLKSTDKEWQMTEARRNFYRAQEYTKGELMPRREKFWAEFKEFAALKANQSTGS